MHFQRFRTVRLTSGRHGRFGLLAAMVALVGQLAFGSLVAPDDAAASRLAALDAISILCDGHSTPDPGGRAPHRHHAADLALCPLVAALAVPGCILPTASPLLAARSRATGARCWERPPGRGPPPATARVAPPRAPPIMA